MELLRRFVANKQYQTGDTDYLQEIFGTSEKG